MQLTGNDELKKYLLNRNDILASVNLSNEEELFKNETNESALDRFPSSLFNKKVILPNKEFVGFMMKETDTKIVVFGDYEQRFDVPKSKTCKVNDNIVLDMEWNEFISYRTEDLFYDSHESK